MRILVVTLSEINRDPRVNRLVKWLTSKNHEITTVSFDEKPGFKVFDHYYINYNKSKIRLLGYKLYNFAIVLLRFFFQSTTISNFLSRMRLFPLLNNILRECRDHKFDYTIVEDLYLLPHFQSAHTFGGLIFDAREYYPSQNEDNVYFRMFERDARITLLKELLPKCFKIFTVSNAIEELYSQRFNVEVSLFRSTPYYKDISISSVGDTIKLVHHGVANSNRQLHKIIDIFLLLESRFELTFYLTGDQPEIKRLQNYSSCERIFFKEPIPFDKLIPELNKYDVGIFYVEPITENLKYCLPNKFFEFIQARLAIVIGPSSEMVDLVKTYDLGICADEFSVQEVANRINALNIQQIDYYKRKSDHAARILCYENEVLELEAHLNGSTA